MTTGHCTEMQLLIQADVDGELTPAEAARVATHLTTCAACAELQLQLLALTGRFRREAPYKPASDALRAAVLGRLAATAPAALPQDQEAPWLLRLRALIRPRLRMTAPFGAGFALAAGLILATGLPSRDDLAGTLVAGHIRALQPGHLLDVVSTDQHTVKPWFDGRLDFAPPVKDMKAAGFPLAGGRLDYVANRPVAALVYQRRQHVIDLFVWPENGAGGINPDMTDRNGYNLLRWNRNGMAFWAVSDISPQELAEFVRAWQGV